MDRRRLRDYRGRHIWKLERAWGHQTSYHIYSYDPQQSYPDFESISAVKAYIVKHQITEGEVWKDHSTYGHGTSRFDHDFWRSINDPGYKRLEPNQVCAMWEGLDPRAIVDSGRPYKEWEPMLRQAFARAIEDHVLQELTNNATQPKT